MEQKETKENEMERKEMMRQNETKESKGRKEMKWDERR